MGILSEPVCANMSGYPVLIKLPTGTWMNVRGGAAVAGPGFEMYLENRTLTRVSPDYPGLIVFETPLPEVQVQTAAPVVATRMAPPPPPQPVRVIEEEAAAEYEDMLNQLPAGAPEPEVADESETWKRIYGGATITVPVVYKLQGMRKPELSFILGRLGLRTDGSRGQCTSRLIPLAGKTLQTKG